MDFKAFGDKAKGMVETAARPDDVAATRQRLVREQCRCGGLSRRRGGCHCAHCHDSVAVDPERTGGRRRRHVEAWRVHHRAGQR